jgi:hypothetical protein
MVIVPLLEWSWFSKKTLLVFSFHLGKACCESGLEHGPVRFLAQSLIVPEPCRWQTNERANCHVTYAKGSNAIGFNSPYESWGQESMGGHWNRFM